MLTGGSLRRLRLEEVLTRVTVMVFREGAKETISEVGMSY